MADIEIPAATKQLVTLYIWVFMLLCLQNT